MSSEVRPPPKRRARRKARPSQLESQRALSITPRRGSSSSSCLLEPAMLRWWRVRRKLAGEGSNMNAVRVRATDVLGRTMLIEPLSFVPHLMGVCVHARLETGEEFYFPAPKVVEVQLRENKLFPIWAKLVAAEGKNWTYYKLVFAEAVSWQRATEEVPA